MFFYTLSRTYFKALFQGVVIQINDGEEIGKVHITLLSRLKLLSAGFSIPIERHLIKFAENAIALQFQRIVKKVSEEKKAGSGEFFRL